MFDDTFLKYGVDALDFHVAGYSFSIKRLFPYQVDGI